MKQLIRRLSRVADSSQYSVLRSPESFATAAPTNRSVGRVASKLRRSRKDSVGVPEGHVPVYVGDEMERFVISAELLNHPVLVQLLERSAQEYGYEQKGVLRIPCHVVVFQRVVDAVVRGTCRGDMLEIDHLLF